jgi:histidine phosphotransferase ChpT
VTVSATDLAARLAARLCHDFANPAGGIQSGLDFLADPTSPIPREDALALIQESARTLSLQLAFARIAFGAGEETFASSALEDLARRLFETIRPTLVWGVEAAALPSPSARVLLNLVQLAGGALASGGEVHVSAGRTVAEWRMSVEAIGSRVRLYPEVHAGLEGRSRGDGLAGRWVQGAFVRALTSDASGAITIDIGGDALRFTAILPV